MRHRPPLETLKVAVLATSPTSKMSRYLLLFLWLRLGSSFVSYSQRKHATTRLHAADGALDELLLSLNDPQVDNLPGPGLCNELCRIRDGEKDVSCGLEAEN